MKLGTRRKSGERADHLNFRRLTVRAGEDGVDVPEPCTGSRRVGGIEADLRHAVPLEGIQVVP
jgi:hypothetical protein